MIVGGQCGGICLTSIRYSGVSEEDLEGVDVNLVDIQRRLLSLFSADTILVGHGLENDLKAVKVSG